MEPYPHDFLSGKWRVHLVYPGEAYGLGECLTYGKNDSYSPIQKPAATLFHDAKEPLPDAR